MPKDILREDIKESICQNLENKGLLAAGSCSYLSCSLFSHSCAPASTNLHRKFCNSETGRSRGEGGFAPAVVIGPKKPQLTLQFQSCIYELNIILHASSHCVL